MIYFKKILFCFFIILVFWKIAISQESDKIDSLNNEFYVDNYIRYKDFVYQSEIKTVKLYPINNIFENPVLNLYSNQQLRLEFDDLSEETKDYTYTILHCNSSWEQSDISVFDYLDGFEFNQIRDYDFSFNTYFHYIHYELLIPNDDIKLKYSGNYLLVIYSDEVPVLTRRFFVVENKADIELNIDRPDIIEYRNSHQEVDFTISTHINIPDPYNDVIVTVRQNGKYDDQIENLKPLYIRDNKLIYDYQDDNCFLGLNEFRYFNTKDIRFESHGIDSILYIKPYYHFFLENSAKRRFKVYFYDEELNGNYFIDVAGGVNFETEADYVYVYFYLPYTAPVVNGNIFVFGALSNWDCTNENKMEYNYDLKRYECRMLLKQGYYNYMFAFYEDSTNSVDINYLEGSHYQTENDYTIFVYLKERSERYEKLISVKTMNSMKKID